MNNKLTMATTTASENITCYDGICYYNDKYECTCKPHNISPNDRNCIRKNEVMR